MSCSPREVFVSTFLLYVTKILAPQDVVHGPEVSSLPGSLLKRQCWDPYRACCLQSHILTKSPGFYMHIKVWEPLSYVCDSPTLLTSVQGLQEAEASSGQHMRATGDQPFPKDSISLGQGPSEPLFHWTLRQHQIEDPPTVIPFLQNQPRFTLLRWSTLISTSNPSRRAEHLFYQLHI